MGLDLSFNMLNSEIDEFFKKKATILEKIQEKLHNPDHSQGTTWVDYPIQYDKQEFQKILTLAENIKKNASALLVIGIGGSYLGTKAGIEMLNSKNGVEIIFAGINLDYIDLYEKLEYLKDKDVFVNVVSKSGTTMEILATFNIVQKFMKKKYKSGYKKRIIFTTDLKKGYLRSLAERENIQTLSVPDNMGGRFSVLSAVGLLPFAVAGKNISNILKGAKAAYKDFAEINENNPAYRYAIYRHLIYSNLNKKIEFISTFSSKLSSFGQWLTQLFNESEGKEGKGLFVTSLNYSTDLHSVGQFIQEGSPIIAETFIDIKMPQKDVVLKGFDKSSPISFVEGKKMSEICNAALQGTIEAHNLAGLPIAKISLSKIDEFNYGYLTYFFELSCAISGYLLGINPFNQPGVEQYKSYMKNLLKL